jgi:hypothetical protein
MTEGEAPMNIPTRRYWSGASSGENLNTLENSIQALCNTKLSFAQTLGPLELAVGEIKRLQEAGAELRTTTVSGPCQDERRRPRNSSCGCMIADCVRDMAASTS